MKHASISGHGISTDGSNDPGACYGGWIERDQARKVVEFKNAFLNWCGVGYVSDLNHGNFNMIASVDLANSEGCDSYQSTHCNSGSATSRGALGIIYPDSGEGNRLNECIRASVQARLPVVYLYTIQRDDYEVAYTDMPAVIWELGFLQSDYDMNLIVNHAKEYGEAIAMGIMDYHGLTQIYLDKIGASSKPKDSKAPTGESVTNSGGVCFGNSYDIYAHGISDEGGIKRVVFPTWTEGNGQDDIKWYEGQDMGGGNYKLTVDVAAHGGQKDLYITHVYAEDNAGNLGYIGATAVRVKALEEKATADLITEKPSTFADEWTVLVTNIKDGETPIKSVVFPTWTESAGQDDLVWMDGTKTTISNGVEAWEFKVKRSDHKNESGDYITHAYAGDDFGNLWYLGAITVKALSDDDRITALEKVVADHEKRIGYLEK